MSKAKITTQQAHRSDTLTRDRKAFELALLKRIELGEEIIARNPRNSTELETNRNDYYRWSEYNSELLMVSFTNPESQYKKEYDNAGSLAFAIGGSYTFSTQVEDFRRDVHYKVEKLRSLVGRIELMPSDDAPINFVIVFNLNLVCFP